LAARESVEGFNRTENKVLSQINILVACYLLKSKLACPRRREMARTGQSQAAGAPIGG
jgi:hypothetical protein